MRILEIVQRKKVHPESNNIINSAEISILMANEWNLRSLIEMVSKENHEILLLIFTHFTVAERYNDDTTYNRKTTKFSARTINETAD